MAKRSKSKSGRRGGAAEAGPNSAPGEVCPRPTPTEPGWSARERWLGRALVAAAAIATFARGVPHPLLSSWDDGRFLIEFEPVQSVSPSHLWTIWSEVHFQAWHPLHLTSYWLDVPWAGPSGPVLHAVNLFGWVLGLWLLLRLFERLGLAFAPALIATLVYGLHPVQVEAVSWATGRKEILALVFAALAFLTHLDEDRYPDRDRWRASSARARARLLARASLPAALFVLAAMSKTTVLPLPAVLFLADVCLRGQPARRALARLLPIGVLGALFGAAVIAIWHGHEMIRPDAGGGEASGRISLVAATFTHYVRTYVAPTELSPVYPIDRTGDFSPAVWILPALYGVALLVAWRARARRALFALGATGALLLPVLNFVPVYFQFQDRYLSLPSLPVAFGVGAALDAVRSRSAAEDGSRSAARSSAGRSVGGRWVARRWVPLALGLAVVVALAVRAVDYQSVWASDRALWRHATRTHPDGFYAWLKLGEHLRDAGELDASIRAYARAIEAAPDLRLSHAAYFNAVAMRDEQRRNLPDRSLAWTERYMSALDAPSELRLVAGEMAQAGYRDAVLLALSRSLDLEPIADQRLERAAAVQLSRGERWLARFYVSRMSRPPMSPQLRSLLR